MNIQVPDDHKQIMRAKEGPFKCSNCEYWIVERNSCNQQDIIDIAKDRNNKYNLKLNLRGEASPLGANDCSDYFEPKKNKRLAVDKSEALPLTKPREI